MKMQGFTLADAVMERSPGQAADIFAGDLVGGTDGAPITIGYGRWGPHTTLSETMAVDDVMVVLEGGLTVSSDDLEVSAGPGDIVHMPKGAVVTIVAGAAGAVTAYVTYPDWRAARG
ncbi:MAG: ethanolamine utilization protein [Phenylobacterium sp.]|uniref:ethanolamine utilization protein n=1 Tax=Phenylobacterium sp. TaxID=1871053 RepID=UPI00391C9B1B